MARKSRVAIYENDENDEKLISYQVGLYVRLSVEDSSDSIENQKQLLLQYLQNKPFTVYEIYVDNGKTGTNFDRPAFKQLLKDVEDKKINCIAIKDFSRLGRNLVETGLYLEKIFPTIGLRVISVNDEYDSESNYDFLLLALKNLMNEMYAKDISKKIRSANQSKMEKGEYLGAFAPYGYIKSPSNKYQLVVDNEVSFVVQNIFQWCVEGISNKQIATKLNEMKISSPSKYKLSKKCYGDGNWNDQTIKQILYNKAYIGHTVQRKKGVNSIIVENTHTPLIDFDIWEKVQTINEHKKSSYFSKLC